jgi:hypothetical protein
MVSSASTTGRVAAVNRNRRVAIALVTLLIVVNLIAILVPAGLGWDFANYYDAGRKVLVGQIGDLYRSDVPISGEAPQGGMTFLSAPITAYLYLPISVLSPEPALVAFKVQSALALGATLYLLWRRLRGLAHGDPEASGRFTILFLAAALLYQPLWTIYRVGGQVTPWALLLLVVGWLFHERGRFWISASCWIAAVAIKPFLAPGLLLLALVSEKRFFVATAVAGMIAAAGSIGLLGWDIHAVFLMRLLEDANRLFPNAYNSGLLAWVDALLIPFEQMKSGLQRPGGIVLVEIAIRISILALWLVLSVSVRRHAERRSLQFLLAMALPVFITPVAWEHYLAFLFPALAVAIAVRNRLSAAGRLLLATIIVVSLGRNLVLIMAVDGLIGSASKAQLVSMALFNSLPITLAIFFLVVFHRKLYAGFADPTAPKV